MNNIKQHLWEVKHPYDCTEGQYTSSQHNFKTIFEYESFSDFLEEWGNADLDYNLVFRWDWEEATDEDEEPIPFSGDVHEKNGTLKIFFMMQRKGYHSCSLVKVCRADEPAVIEFLTPRMEVLRRLWAPLMQPSA